jgi:hypothetical protein
MVGWGPPHHRPSFFPPPPSPPRPQPATVDTVPPTSSPALRVMAVTALYDIGREASDGRSSAKYLNWLRDTCALPVDLTIFLHDVLSTHAAALLAARPPGFTTRLVIESQEQGIPLWRDVTQVTAILGAGAPLPWVVHTRAMEFINPRYTPLVQSKPAFVARAIAADVAAEGAPADAYLWVDAGLSRFIPPGTTGASTRLKPSFIGRTLARDRIVAAADEGALATYAGKTIEDLEGRGGGAVLGGLLVGPPHAWGELRSLSEAIWRSLLERGRITNEQQVWSLLLQPGGKAEACLEVVHAPLRSGHHGFDEFPFFHDVFMA